MSSSPRQTPELLPSVIAIDDAMLTDGGMVNVGAPHKRWEALMTDEVDVQEPTTVGAQLVPEGPNVALVEIQGLLEYLTPVLLLELATFVLKRMDDENATVALLQRVCRAEPETWAIVAEQLTQLLVRRHDLAVSALEEADALQRDADVMRCNGLSEKRAIEVAALTVMRAFPTVLTARLLGAQLQNVAEAE